MSSQVSPLTECLLRARQPPQRGLCVPSSSQQQSDGDVRCILPRGTRRSRGRHRPQTAPGKRRSRAADARPSPCLAEEAPRAPTSGPSAPGCQDLSFHCSPSLLGGPSPRSVLSPCTRAFCLGDLISLPPWLGHSEGTPGQGPHVTVSLGDGVTLGVRFTHSFRTHPAWI